jgi:hypothetical protein
MRSTVKKKQIVETAIVSTVNPGWIPNPAEALSCQSDIQGPIFRVRVKTEVIMFLLWPILIFLSVFEGYRKYRRPRP